MTNATSVQLQQAHDKVMQALFSDYFYPCLFAVVALGLLLVVIAVVKSLFRRKFQRSRGRQTRK